MLPNFIGIGAPRTGTTWLARCLREHPEIFVAKVKETNFFDYAKIDGRVSDYEAHFKGSERAKAIGEVCTRYLTSSRARERIKTWLPNVRLFVSLRNPIEQVNSHYWHLARQNFHQWNGTNSSLSIQEALDVFRDRLLEPAFFAKHLVEWLRYFDRDQIFILLYDDIRNRPQEVLASLYAFLGVDRGFIPPSLHRRDSTVRRGTSPRSRAMSHTHSVIYGQMNRNAYHPLKKIIGTRAAAGLTETLRIRPIMEWVFRRKGYPPLPEAIRDRLCACFREDVEKLDKLLGRDLSHWLDGSR